MKKLATLTIITTLALAGCSNDAVNETQSAVQSQDTTVNQSDDSHLHPTGTLVEAPGVTLSVDNVSRAETIEVYADGYKQGTRPNESLTSNKGEFISVKTTVKNTGQYTMDLTCGFGVQAVLFNMDNQQYLPIDSLYRVIGNPECNDNFGPGFDTQMTWVFEVPKGTELGAFGFADPEEHYGDLTFVDLREEG